MRRQRTARKVDARRSRPGRRQGGPGALDRAVDAYLAYLVSERGLAQQTVSAYAMDLAQLTSFLDSRGRKRLSAITLSDLQDFVSRLASRGRSPRTRARVVASTRGFFAFLQDNGTVRTSPATLLQARRLPGKLPRPLGQTEVRRLLAAAGDTPRGIRDTAMLELLYASGLRVSELVTLRTEALDLEGGCVRVCGKGERERVVPIGSKAYAALGAYLERARPLLAGGRQSPYVKDSGSASRDTPARSGYRPRSGRTRSATRLPHTCWRAGLICGQCKRCSVMPISVPRRSTHMSFRTACVRSTEIIIRGHGE
jgi:integrase/recombinase XerD